jgi:hypothetical protein
LKNKSFNLAKPLFLIIFVSILALFFAQVEIQIEGAAGWAANLPTWRIEHHWLLDIFWGGRPMTGYHAWVFPFMLLIFHLPAVLFSQWSWRLEARILGCVALFWIIEDALWFLLNPAFGMAKFNPANVPWHIHWWGFMPTDYWTFGGVGLALVFVSYFTRQSSSKAR